VTLVHIPHVRTLSLRITINHPISEGEVFSGIWNRLRAGVRQQAETTGFSQYSLLGRTAASTRFYTNFRGLYPARVAETVFSNEL
jgi:hypothetical protein